MLENNIKKQVNKTIIWVLGVMVSIIFSLVGLVYANLQKQIDSKADVDIVVHLLQTTDEIQKDVKLILRDMPRD